MPSMSELAIASERSKNRAIPSRLAAYRPWLTSRTASSASAAFVDNPADAISARLERRSGR